MAYKTIPLDKTAQFIEAVHTRPQLYAKHHPDYKNRLVRDNCFNAIAEAEFPDFSGHDLAQNWARLRERMGRELKGEVSGAAGGWKSKWEFFESLLFLKEHIMPRKTVSNYRRTEADKTKSPASSSTSSSSIPAIRRPRKGKAAARPLVSPTVPVGTPSTSSSTHVSDMSVEELEQFVMDITPEVTLSGDENTASGDDSAGDSMEDDDYSLDDSATSQRQSSPAANSSQLQHKPQATKRVAVLHASKAKRPKESRPSGGPDSVIQEALGMLKDLNKENTEGDSPEYITAMNFATKLKNIDQRYRISAELEIMQILAKYSIDHPAV